MKMKIECETEILEKLLEATELMGRIKHLREYEPGLLHQFERYMAQLRDYAPILRPYEDQLPGVQQVLTFIENPPVRGKGKFYGYRR